MSPSLPAPPRPAQSSVRIALVQLRPLLGAPARNVRRVEQLLSRARLGRDSGVDLVVLPELALAGYKFAHTPEVQPFLEPTPRQPGGRTPPLGHPPSPAPSLQPPSWSLSLARSVATRLGAYVLIGFAERADRADAASPRVRRGLCVDTCTGVSVPWDARPQQQRQARDSPPLHHPAASGCPVQAHVQEQQQHPVTAAHAETEDTPYNSALLVSRSGQVLHVFRKHFLYEDDHRWARAGSGLQFIDLPDLGRMVVGICMDLNPWEFKSDFESYELARFAARAHAHMLVVPMAWSLPEDERQAKEQSSAQQGRVRQTTPQASTAQVHSLPNASRQVDPGQESDAGEKEVNAALLQEARDRVPSTSTINYWAWRCTPLWSPQDQNQDEPANSDSASASQTSSTVLAVCNRVGDERGATFAGSGCVMTLDRRRGRPVLVDCLGAGEERILLVETPLSSHGRASS